MNFSILYDTAETKVGELVPELRGFLEPSINKLYSNYNFSIGFAIRCLPNAFNRRSFTRYTLADNYLVIDFNMSAESFEKLYKIEARFKLGHIFLQWLDKGLSNKRFIENNKGFDADSFKLFILDLGLSHGWFVDEIDWSLDWGR